MRGIWVFTAFMGVARMRSSAPAGAGWLGDLESTGSAILCVHGLREAKRPRSTAWLQAFAPLGRIGSGRGNCFEKRVVFLLRWGRFCDYWGGVDCGVL